MARIVKKNNYYKNLANNSSKGPGVSKSSNSSSSYRKSSSSSSSKGPGVSNTSKYNNKDYEEPTLSVKERREIQDHISDLTSLKNALSDNNSDNIRSKIETAKKLLQAAQEDLGYYWKEPQAKVNEYTKRIEDQKILVNNLIKKIDDEILVSLSKEISQNQNILGG